MFTWFKNMFTTTKETDMTFAKIDKVGSRFGVVTRDGEILSTYGRARDARRGAARQGITVYN